MTTIQDKITINIHVHGDSDKGQPKIKCVNTKSDELESIDSDDFEEIDHDYMAWKYDKYDGFKDMDDEYTEGPSDKKITNEMREEARKFYRDHFHGYGFEACFSDYKGIELSQLPLDAATKFIQEIVDALKQLPIPPANILEHEDVVFATWEFPFLRRFLPFTDNEFCTMMDNFYASLGKIGISTPRKCDSPDSDIYDLDLYETEEERVLDYFKHIKPLMDFDKMCGLRITAVNQSESLAKYS